MAYTTINDPSAYFYVYNFSKSSGTGSVTFDANSDLQPDFLWVKSRSNADGHELWDSTRGVNSTLFSHANEAEDTAANRIVSFDTDGFTWGNAGNLNAAGTFVSWAWKANAGSTSSNTDGNVTSTVQANTDAGFSIIEYTGTGSTSSTIGHGLGVTPDVIIFKRTDAGTNNWDVQWKGELRVTLNRSDAQATNVLCTFTSTTTDLGSTATAEKNQSGATYIAYAFASKQGYSKFGKYTGNGNANGAFVYTGFKPAFLIVKRTDSTGNWLLYDNKGEPGNMIGDYFYVNFANAESGQSTNGYDFLSNGFKVRNVYGDGNVNGGTYIYMAFAENPFVTSTGVPTTAR